MTLESSHTTAPAPPPRHQPAASLRPRPPLSIATYFRRNLHRTIPVGSAIAISVFLIAAIVTLLNSVDTSITTNYGFVRCFSVFGTQLEKEVPPRALAKARQAPHLAEAIRTVPYLLPLKTVFGEMPVPVYGVPGDNDHATMKRLAQVTGNRLADGRWPQANEPEIALSRQWARNFRTKVGGWIELDSDRVPTLTEKQRVVGILEGGENLALADLDYLLAELPDPVVRPNYILIPDNPANLAKLNAAIDAFIDKPVAHGLTVRETEYVKFYTFDGLVQAIRKSLGFLYTFLGIADAMVIGAVALLSAFLANIYFEQRLPEFGLLSAFGFRRERLVRRVVGETAILVTVGWCAGLGLTWFVFMMVDLRYMTPRGLVLAHIDRAALLYTLPTPIIVGLASLATVLLRLYRMNPIDIMERR